MKTYWSQSKSYSENYKTLKANLDKDTRYWIIDQEPPQDGTQIYFLCRHQPDHNNQYDIGYWADYTGRKSYSPEAPYPECLEGEWDTEFGNCEEILGWKPVL